MNELEGLERERCNLPLVFAEMFKDEINANEEHKLYSGVKRIIRKYTGNREAMTAINEFTSVISGGASLNEILLIAKDEVLNPTAASEVTVNQECYREPS